MKISIILLAHNEEKNIIAEEDKILLYKIYIKIKKEFENLDKSKL